jgi:hypothetical protein
MIFFILTAVSAVNLKQSLGQVYGTPGEAFTLDLLDYFDGSDLNFTTSLPNLTVLDDNELYMAAQFIYPSQPSNSSASVPSCSRKLFTTQDSSGGLVFISYSSTTLYMTSYDGVSLTPVSSLPILTGMANASIIDMTQSEDKVYLYVAVAGEYSTYSSTDFYLVSIADLAKPVQLKQNAITAHTAVNWLKMQTSGKYVLVTGYIDVFIAHQSIVTVLDISNLIDSRVQELLLGTAYPISFAVDTAFLDNSTFVLVDSEANIYKYLLLNNQLFLKTHFQMTPFHSPLSLSESQGRILIGFPTSVVLMDAETLNLISVVETDFNATSVNLQLDGDIAYVNLYSENASLLLILDFSKNKDSLILRRWDLVGLIPTGVSRLAPFSVFKSQGYYVRSDDAFLSVLRLRVGSERLFITASNSSYSADVSAFSRSSPEDKVKSVVTVSSTAEFNQAVATLEGRYFSTNPVVIDLELFNEQPLTMVVYPDSYFAGPLANYTLHLNSTSHLSISANSSFKYVKSTMPEATNEFIVSTGNCLLVYVGSYYEVFTYANATFNYTFTLNIGPSAVVAASDFLVAGYTDGQIVYESFASSKSTQTKATSVPCKSILIDQSTLFCSDDHTIEMYDASSGFLGLPGTLSNVSVTNVPQFDIIDFAVSSDSSLYVYIADAQLGLLSVVVTTFNPAATYTAIKFGEASGVIKAFAVVDLVYFLIEDGSVLIYSQHPLVLIRTLHGKGPPIRYSSSSSILALQYEHFTEIIDLHADAYSANYVQVPTNSSCSIATPSDSAELSSTLFLNCPEDYPDNLYLTKVSVEGRRRTPTSPIEAEVFFSIASKGKVYSNFTAEGQLTASNSAGSSSLKVVVHAKCFVQSISGKGFPQANSTVLPYSASDSFPLSRMFQGQNLKFQLIVNGVASDSDSGPAYISSKLRLVKWFDLPSSNFTDMAVCQNCSLTLATTTDDFYVFESAGDNDTYTKVDVSLIANHISRCSGVVINDQLLYNNMMFDLFCTTLQEEFYSSYSQKYTANYVYTLAIDLDVRTFQQQGYTAGSQVFPEVQFYWHRIDVNTSLFIGSNENFDFEKQTYSNNVLTLYKLCAEDYQQCFDCYNRVYLNCVDLGLQSFSVSAADVKSGSRGVALYVADSLYGLRVLNSTHVNETAQVTSIEFNQTLVSLGVCDDWLFLGDAEEGVHKYSIADPFNPVLVESLFKLGNMQGARGNIKCTSHTKFAAVPLFSADGFFTVRILDLLEPSEFSIFADIKCNGTNATSFPGAFEFLDNSTISIVSSNNKRDYKISPSVLQYPEMSKQQYQDMLGKWGTNMFSLSVNVSTEDQVIRTSQFYLQRTGPLIEVEEADNRSSCLVVLIWLAVL